MLGGLLTTLGVAVAKIALRAYAVAEDADWAAHVADSFDDGVGGARAIRKWRTWLKSQQASNHVGSEIASRLQVAVDPALKKIVGGIDLSQEERNEILAAASTAQIVINGLVSTDSNRDSDQTLVLALARPTELHSWILRNGGNKHRALIAPGRPQAVFDLILRAATDQIIEFAANAKRSVPVALIALLEQNDSTREAISTVESSTKQLAEETSALVEFTRQVGQFLTKKYGKSWSEPNPSTASNNINSSYLEAMVRPFAPDSLLDRGPEIHKLAEDARDVGCSWLFVQALPQAGKTALAATFAVHPPDDLIVVPFFIRSYMVASRDRAAFLDAVFPQLAAIAGRPDLVRPASAWQESSSLRDLIVLALESIRETGPHKRLILLIDGVDEDYYYQEPSTNSILSALPIDLPPGAAIVLFGRSNPPVPSDLPTRDGFLHPLYDEGIYRTIEVSSHAKAAFRDEDVASLTRNRLGLDLAGFLMAAGDSLSATNLAELLFPLHPEVTSDAVDLIMTRSSGRLFNAFPNKNAGRPVSYALGHDLIAHSVIRRLLPGEPNVPIFDSPEEWSSLIRRGCLSYISRLFEWARAYENNSWPDETPTYLLGDSYPRLLLSSASEARLVTTLCSEQRIELLFKITGSNLAAIMQVRTAIDSIRSMTTVDGLITQDRIWAIGRLLQTANRLNSETDVPPLLPSIFARAANTSVARDIANSVSDARRRTTTLANLALTFADLGYRQTASDVAADAQVSDLQATEIESQRLSAHLSFEWDQISDFWLLECMDAVVGNDSPEELAARPANPGLLVALSSIYARRNDQARASHFVNLALDGFELESEPVHLETIVEMARASAGATEQSQVISTSASRRLFRAAERHLDPRARRKFGWQHTAPRGLVLARVSLVNALLGNFRRASSLATRCQYYLDEEFHRSEEEIDTFVCLTETLMLLGLFETGSNIARLGTHAISKLGMFSSYRETAYKRLGKVLAANDLDEEVDDLIKRTNESGRISVMCEVARAYATSQRFSRSLEILQGAISLADPSGSSYAEWLTDIADALVISNDPIQASKVASEALRACRASSDRESEQRALSEVAHAYVAVSDPDRAYQAVERLGFQDSEFLRHSLAPPIARLFALNGNFDRARDLIGGWIDNMWNKLDVYLTIARNLVEVGHVNEGISCIEWVESNAELADASHLRTLIDAAALYLECGLPAQARLLLSRLADSLTSNSRDSDGSGYSGWSDETSLVSIAEIYLKLEDHLAVSELVHGATGSPAEYSVIVGVAGLYSRRKDVERARYYGHRALFILAQATSGAAKAEIFSFAFRAPESLSWDSTQKLAETFVETGDIVVARSVESRNKVGVSLIEGLVHLSNHYLRFHGDGAVMDVLLDEALQLLDKERASIAWRAGGSRSDYEMRDRLVSQIGDALMARGQVARAHELAGKFHSLRRRGRYLLRVADAYLGMSLFDMARSVLQESEKSLVVNDDDSERSLVSREDEQWKIAVITGFARAADSGRARQLVRQLDKVQNRVAAFIACSAVYLAHGEFTAAESTLDDALSLLQEIINPKTREELATQCADSYCAIWTSYRATWPVLRRRSEVHALADNAGATDLGRLQGKAVGSVVESWVAASYPRRGWEALLTVDRESAILLETNLF